MQIGTGGAVSPLVFIAVHCAAPRRPLDGCPVRRPTSAGLGAATRADLAGRPAN